MTPGTPRLSSSWLLSRAKNHHPRVSVSPILDPFPPRRKARFFRPDRLLHHHGPRGLEEAGAVEISRRALRDPFPVGGIQEYEVEPEAVPLKETQRGPVFHRQGVRSRRLKSPDVAAHDRECAKVRFHQDGHPGSARKGLEAERPGPREQVQYPCFFRSASQNVEDRLPHAVGRRPHRLPPRGAKPPAPPFPRYDAHTRLHARGQGIGDDSRRPLGAEGAQERKRLPVCGERARNTSRPFRGQAGLSAAMFAATFPGTNFLGGVQSIGHPPVRSAPHYWNFTTLRQGIPRPDGLPGHPFPRNDVVHYPRENSEKDSDENSSFFPRLPPFRIRVARAPRPGRRPFRKEDHDERVRRGGAARQHRRRHFPIRAGGGAFFGPPPERDGPPPIFEK